MSQVVNTQVFQAATPAALTALVNPFLNARPADQIKEIQYSASRSGAAVTYSVCIIYYVYS